MNVWTLQGVVNWAYGGEAYELVTNSLQKNGQGGGALGSLLLPRPTAAAGRSASSESDRDEPVCPRTRLLVISYGVYTGAKPLFV